MISEPTSQAKGPYDAAFLPRLRMSFRAAPGPVTDPVSKFGGQPVWLDGPAWPVHPRTGEPLVFIGQFRVPGNEVRLAYLFLHEEGMDMGGNAAEDGEAVVLVQPGGRIPSFASIGPPSTQGRTLWRWGPDDTEVPVEWLTDLAPMPPELDEAASQAAAWSRWLRSEGPEVEYPYEERPKDFLEGEALYPNDRVFGIDSSWLFFCQFEDRGEAESDPFFLNFGYGSGFLFLSSDHLEGRFMWDCSY
ncbi:hypothetical protein [Streptomyces roseicoloratus]|uniref:hypothetical protein n=1 Tax=Streptomyces roseicoloratus TaxID=2508722 RepID=UPI0010099708|nr:hypothetical protein [Streptomyces roseicoloratus]